MKLSVVLPVYNVENYIKECLDSILCQEFTNFELIIIDDGSVDNTREIVSDYKDYRIRYFFQENSGLSAARNLGITKAEGDFIIFIDSDDIIKPDLFKKCILMIDSKKLDMLFFGFQMFSCSEGGEKIFGKERIPNVSGILESTDGLKELFKDNIPHFSWANMIRRSTLINNNIRFPENRNYEDFATTYKLIYFSERIGFIDDTSYLYRQRDNSIMHKASDKESENILISEHEIVEFIEKNEPSIKALSYNYIFRRLFDALRYTNNNELTIRISKDLMKSYKLLDRKYLSKVSKMKFLLFRLKILKLVYLFKKGL